jgi:hypothetical protein
MPSCGDQQGFGPRSGSPWWCGLALRIDLGESFSPVVFLYGMAFVPAVDKAFTLLIRRTLPKPRPPLPHEVKQAWHRRTARAGSSKNAAHVPQEREPAVDPIDVSREELS